MSFPQKFLVFGVILQLGVILSSEGYFIGPGEADEGFSVAVAETATATSPLPRRRPVVPVVQAQVQQRGKGDGPMKDSLFDDKYKPWGAASVPNATQQPTNTVVLDKVDEELFAPASERHEYDQRAHQESRMKLLYQS